MIENISIRPAPIQISKEEIEIINDIRRIDFGRISLVIQNGIAISKEVTTTTKMRKKNTNSGNNGAGCEKLKKRGDYLALLLINLSPIIEKLADA